MTPSPAAPEKSDMQDTPALCYDPRMPKTKKRAPVDTATRDLLHFKVAPDEVAYKCITQKLRDLILAKALLPGTRLPTLSELARLWNTNYFTVQTALTPLVNEGLLVRKQRTGTFVAENTRQIKAVGIYLGDSFWRVKHAAFYQTLYTALCDHFEKLGIDTHLYMDSRPLDQQETPLEPLLKAIERSKVNAVVGAMVREENTKWLDRLGVPVGLFGGHTAAQSVQCSVKGGTFLSSSLQRLKERKCRSVALITGKGMEDFESFMDLATQLGLKTRREWVLQRNQWPEDFEAFGFESFSRIWAGKEKPDGLIISPDNIALGVIMAILQNGARVPEELKLVMHCNEEIYFHCPLPADWQTVSIVKIVEGLWKTLQLQAEGKKPRRILVPITLSPASAQSPPIYRKWKSTPFPDHTPRE